MTQDQKTQQAKAAPGQPDNLVELSQYRARLARGQRARRAEELFAAPDPAAAIQALPPDEFYYVLHETGFPEAMEVLVHGTAEQIQTVLDFSVWERDRVSLDKSNDWLAALVEAPPQKLGEWAQGIDVELLALLIRQRTRIHDLSVEEAPEETEGTLWNTPDRLFAVDILGEPDQARVTQHLLDSLYRYSPVMMRRLLVGVRAESDAEMEDMAFRWRAGRMADLGFIPFEEALAVYQEIDPATVRVGDSVLGAGPRAADENYLRLPQAMVERLSSKSGFARAVAGLPSREEASEVHAALVALCNRVLSADRIEPSDDEAIRASLERVSATLDLAVELLARDEQDRAVAAVRGVPLLTLHRLGVSLVGKLRKLAVALVCGNPFAALRPAIEIFEADDADVLSSLGKARPLFPRILETPPAAGERPFATLADIALATHAVERAAASVELLAGLGIRPQQLTPEGLALLAQGPAPSDVVQTIDPASIDAGLLARTVLVARLVTGPSAGLQVLSPELIQKFKQHFICDTQHIADTEVMAMDLLRSSSPSRTLEGAASEVASRWVKSLSPLSPVLGKERP